MEGLVESLRLLTGVLISAIFCSSAMAQFNPKAVPAAPNPAAKEAAPGVAPAPEPAPTPPPTEYYYFEGCPVAQSYAILQSSSDIVGGYKFGGYYLTIRDDNSTEHKLELAAWGLRLTDAVSNFSNPMPEDLLAFAGELNRAAANKTRIRVKAYWLGGKVTGVEILSGSPRCS